jgi:hypothetical protein
MGNAAATALRAGEHDAKPNGTRRNRIASGASADQVRSAGSTPGGSRGFFQNRPPPDGPRWPGTPTGPLPAADAHALGNGTIADGEAPCPAGWPDSAGPPAAVTKDGRLRCTPRYSTVNTDEGARTTSRTPSRDRFGHGRGQVLVAAARGNHAGHGPRERQLPKVKSRQRSLYSAPGRLGLVTSCLPTPSPA